MVASTWRRRLAVSGLVFIGMLLGTSLVLLTLAAGGARAAGEGTGSPTMAVLDLAADKVSKATAEAVSDSLRARLRLTGKFDIPDREAVLTAAGGSAVCSEKPCAVTIGRKLGAGSVVIGSVSRFGRLITVSVTILDLYSEQPIDDFKVESLDGEAGIPAAVGQLAGLIEARKRRVSLGGVPYPDDVEHERIQQMGTYETSLAFGVGMGVRGYDSNTTRCKASGATKVCQGLTGDFKWLIDLSMLTRMRHSRWVFGLKGGLLAVDTGRRNEYQGPTIDVVTGGSSSKGFFLGPQLGYVVQRSPKSRLLAFACAGYRDFDDASGVDRTFATTGLAFRLYMVNANLAYWRAFGSDSLFNGLVTAGLGFVMGF
jgi:hypothetical protein